MSYSGCFNRQGQRAADASGRDPTALETRAREPQKRNPIDLCPENRASSSDERTTSDARRDHSPSTIRRYPTRSIRHTRSLSLTLVSATHSWTWYGGALALAHGSLSMCLAEIGGLVGRRVLLCELK